MKNIERSVKSIVLILTALSEKREMIASSLARIVYSISQKKAGLEKIIAYRDQYSMDKVLKSNLATSTLVQNTNLFIKKVGESIEYENKVIAKLEIAKNEKMQELMAIDQKIHGLESYQDFLNKKIAKRHEVHDAIFQEEIANLKRVKEGGVTSF